MIIGKADGVNEDRVEFFIELRTYFEGVGTLSVALVYECNTRDVVATHLTINRNGL